jgi:LacI family transcriptional regulator
MKTLREIAQTLNLSDGTVSRALSGRGDIAQVTRERVMKLAEECNYSPRRKLPQQNSAPITRIAVCIGNLCLGADGALDSSYVGLHILAQIERTTSSAGVSVMVGFVDAMAAGQRVDQLPILQRGESKGIILVYPFPEPVVKQLAARAPVVSIEHVYPCASLDVVGPTHSVDVMSAVEHLYKLGHRRIGYVSDDEACGHKLTLGLRHAGYVSGLARCNLPYRPEDVFNVFSVQVEKPQLAAAVAERVNDGVTAVISSIDRHGYLLWEQLPRMGVRVPEDVSLVGIGGIHRAEGLSQLTTWRCDYAGIASVAFDSLKLRRAARRSGGSYQEISSVFVEGESCSAPSWK